MKLKKKKISLIITYWLVVIVLAACAVSVVLIYLTLAERAENQTIALVQQNVEDVSVDIDELADGALITFLDDFFQRGLDSVTSIEDPDDLSKTLQTYYPNEGVEVSTKPTQFLPAVKSA